MDRPSFGSRGGRGGAGGGRGGSRPHSSSGAGGGASGPKKESILDLAKYMNKSIRVKCMGGREVMGCLKGFDPLSNLVLDDAVEFLKDPITDRWTDRTRRLGLVVCRGTAITTISPAEMEEIANPFLPAA